MSEEREKQPAFVRLAREPRLSDRVADLLLETIVSNGLRAGDRLPSERELGEQFGVSRTVIREAARALAAKGIIEVRTGSGLRVAAVGANTVAESMHLFLLGRDNLDYSKVHEVRTIIEVQVAHLAAARADADDLSNLERVCAQMAEVLGDRDAAAHADVAFHRAVADCTHNELFGVMLDTIGGALLKIRLETMALPGRVDQALDDHRRILGRVVARDPDGASEAMRAHLEDVRTSWEEARRVAGSETVERDS